MRIKEFENDWYGFDHASVLLKFGGTKFIGEFSIKDGFGNFTNNPVAVYYAESPDKSKGHKNYFLLWVINGAAFISGKTVEEMEENRYQNAVHCLECDNVIYSRARHDMVYCGCPNKAFVDGGRVYFRSGARSLDQIRHVEIDLINKKVKINDQRSTK